MTLLREDILLIRRSRGHKGLKPERWPPRLIKKEQPGRKELKRVENYSGRQERQES